jgi:hypothetical protein
LGPVFSLAAGFFSGIPSCFTVYLPIAAVCRRH